jgi:hypothetical protein
MPEIDRPNPSRKFRKRPPSLSVLPIVRRAMEARLRSFHAIGQ